MMSLHKWLIRWPGGLYEAYAAVCTSSTNNVVAGSKVQPIKKGDLDELMDEVNMSNKLICLYEQWTI